MASLPESHVAVNLRCSLCDHDFPETDGDPPPYPVVCLFDTNRVNTGDESKAKHVVALATDVREYYTAPGSRKRFQSHHSASDMPGHTDPWPAGCGYCLPRKALFIAHWDCWRMVRASTDISLEHLHEFAFQAMPLAPSLAGPHSPLSLSDLVASISRETSFGRLIVDILERLPPELHSKIMREAQLDAMSFQHYGTMNERQYRSLMSASGVLFTRLATVQLSTIPTLRSGFVEVEASVPGVDLDRITTMYVRPVYIFGAAYIAQTGFSDDQELLPCITVRSEDIRGVRFALGRFGLRGLRLLYADGSASSWLGNTSGCWYGNVRGESIRDLHVVTKGPRVVCIAFPSPLRSPDPRISALLDWEIDAPNGELLPFISKPDIRKPFFSTPLYPTQSWKFIRCLPLLFGSTYTTGLTIFWDQGVVKGMASYGPNNETATVGLCTGDAVHFPLASGEYFTSFWIRMGYTGPLSPEPFLLTFGTSTGRSAHFGPQILMRPFLTDAMLRHRWEAISSWAGPTFITGILVEALAEWHLGGYRGFGVVQNPLGCSNDEEELVRPTVPEINVVSPDPLDYFDFQETLLSTGSLSNVEEIEVRRKGVRCVGMRIVHAAGLDDYLGSWDPTDTPSISTVYESSQHGSLTNLFFNVFFKADRKPIIFDIIPNDGSNSTTASQKVKTLRILPIEEAGLLTDDSLPDDFLVEFRCDHPRKMLAWYHDERSTEARCFVSGDQKPIGRNLDADPLYAFAWEPPVGEYRTWFGQEAV